MRTQSLSFSTGTRLGLQKAAQSAADTLPSYWLCQFVDVDWPSCLHCSWSLENLSFPLGTSQNWKQLGRTVNESEWAAQKLWNILLPKFKCAYFVVVAEGAGKLGLAACLSPGRCIPACPRTLDSSALLGQHCVCLWQLSPTLWHSCFPRSFRVSAASHWQVQNVILLP